MRYTLRTLTFMILAIGIGGLLVHLFTPRLSEDDLRVLNCVNRAENICNREQERALFTAIAHTKLQYSVEFLDGGLNRITVTNWSRVPFIVLKIEFPFSGKALCLWYRVIDPQNVPILLAE